MRGGLVRESMSLRMYFEAPKAMCYPQFILLASFFCGWTYVLSTA